MLKNFFVGKSGEISKIFINFAPDFEFIPQKYDYIYRKY